MYSSLKSEDYKFIVAILVKILAMGINIFFFFFFANPPHLKYLILRVNCTGWDAWGCDRESKKIRRGKDKTEKEDEEDDRKEKGKNPNTKSIVNTDLINLRVKVSREMRVNNPTLKALISMYVN